MSFSNTVTAETPRSRGDHLYLMWRSNELQFRRIKLIRGVVFCCIDQSMVAVKQQAIHAQWSQPMYHLPISSAFIQKVLTHEFIPVFHCRVSTLWYHITNDLKLFLQFTEHVLSVMPLKIWLEQLTSIIRYDFFRNSIEIYTRYIEDGSPQKDVSELPLLSVYLGDGEEEKRLNFKIPP